VRNPRCLTSVIFAVVLACASASCGKTVSEAIDDTTITTRVKTAILNDTAVNGHRIDVETFKGVVTLSGRVESEMERDRVAALARGISGVVEVKDALTVQNP
jgi:osmotically-inducible protein OsmY